jgi:hypothetical protein
VLAREAVDGHSQLGDALAAALVGFLLAMVSQRKPWIYLAIPSGVLSLVLLVTTVLETSGRVSTRAGRLARALLVLVTALRAGRYAWWLVHAPVIAVSDRMALADYTRLRMVLDSLPHGTSFAALSPTHGVVFPLVQDVGGRWTMRLPSLWSAMSGAARSPEIQAQLRQLVAQDIQRHRPDVLIVLVPGSVYSWLGPDARRDWIAWLRESPEGRQAVSPYRRWRDLGEFVLLRR